MLLTKRTTSLASILHFSNHFSNLIYIVLRLRFVGLGKTTLNCERIDGISAMMRVRFHILVIIHFATLDEQAFSSDNRFTGGFRVASVMDVKNRTLAWPY